MGVAQPAWQPGLCFKRTVLVGGGAALIQIGLHRLASQALQTHPSPVGGSPVSWDCWCQAHRDPLPFTVALLTFVHSSLWCENRRSPDPCGEPWLRTAVGGGGPARAPSRLWLRAQQTSLVCSRCAWKAVPHDSPGSSCYYQFSFSSLTGSRSRKVLAGVQPC